MKNLVWTGRYMANYLAHGKLQDHPTTDARHICGHTSIAVMDPLGQFITERTENERLCGHDFHRQNKMKS